MTGMLTLTENEDFYFDAEAADRPVRFIEKFCRHYEGVFVGTPFILAPLQKQIVRDLFGWKWRSTGLRRFNECYFEAAVGAGKSPLLAAIGLYGLMADGEAGAQVYSLASTYGQARVVFECAKSFIAQNVELECRLEVTQYEIRHPRSRSFWRIVSGNGPGAGCRPSMVLGDEAHEWKTPGARQALRDRMSKRRQPLEIIATNAGDSRASFCWRLREKAVAALEGHGDPTLYPIIWCADENADTDDPDAWHQANPLMGITVAEEKVRLKCAEVMKDEDEEANFRRLYMGLWPKTGVGRWLNLALWDAATARYGKTDTKDAALYVGFDLSQCDDLSAVADLWVTPDRFVIDTHFWLPLATAERYHEKHGIDYAAWAKAGHLTLIEEPTISENVRRQIAAAIVAKQSNHKIKAVCYDRFKADVTVAVLEATGLTCVPVPQGYSVSPGCQEFERRLKDSAVEIAPNPVLRFCAENVEVKTDDRGNIWPVKPAAKGRYAGERWRKIDGITAIVTAATEARKHAFPAAKTETARAILI